MAEYEWEDLLDRTKEDFGCQKHQVVKVRDAVSGWVCPVCLVEESRQSRIDRIISWIRGGDDE